MHNMTLAVLALTTLAIIAGQAAIAAFAALMHLPL